MTSCKSSILLFLAMILLLLASASCQTTESPPPLMTPPPAPAPPPSMGCTKGIISSLRNCTVSLLQRLGNAEGCCPFISELPNKVAARCVCSSLRTIGITFGIENIIASQILLVCTKAPTVTIDCNKA
uniref:Uncharacterized protein n=1 Tax=Leersia perrieri TaxID=77586 RepID=A0A0D9VVW0_9ORYZ